MAAAYDAGGPEGGVVELLSKADFTAAATAAMNSGVKVAGPGLEGGIFAGGGLETGTAGVTEDERVTGSTTG